MLRFLVDEDLPRTLAAELRAQGVRASDVREVGLRGDPDEAVFSRCAAEGLALISADLGFANEVKFPPGAIPYLVIVRFPTEMSVASLQAAIVRSLSQLEEAELQGNLLVIEPGRTRLRRRA